MTDLLKQLISTTINGEIEVDSDGSLKFIAKRAPIGEKFFPEIKKLCF